MGRRRWTDGQVRRGAAAAALLVVAIATMGAACESSSGSTGGTTDTPDAASTVGDGAEGGGTGDAAAPGTDTAVIRGADTTEPVTDTAQPGTDTGIPVRGEDGAVLNDGAGGGGVDVGPAPGDTSIVPDTTTPPDTWGGDMDAGPPAPDTGSTADTGGGTGTCSSNDPICRMPPAGTGTVSISQKSGNAPALMGGTPPTGLYSLTAVDVYPDSINNGQPNALVALSVSDNGATSGAVDFDDAQSAWALGALLDLALSVSVSAIGIHQSLDFNQEAGDGGCYSINGDTIEGDSIDGDLLEYGSGFCPSSRSPTRSTSRPSARR